MYKDKYYFRILLHIEYESRPENPFKLYFFKRCFFKKTVLFFLR